MGYYTKLSSDRIHKLAKKAKRIIPDLHIKKEKKAWSRKGSRYLFDNL